jgi:hypothetical protein
MDPSYRQSLSKGHDDDVGVFGWTCNPLGRGILETITVFAETRTRSDKALANEKGAEECRTRATVLDLSLMFCYTRKRTQSTKIHYKNNPSIPNTKKLRKASPKAPCLAHSSNRVHSFKILIASHQPFSSGCSAVGPSEADIATRDHRTLAAAIATQHHYQLCWPTHHSMKAAGCCCCCNRAAGSAAPGIGSGSGRIAAGCCRLLGRGLEVCDREPSRCRGKAGSRAFCDDGR